MNHTPEVVESWEPEFDEYFSDGYIRRISAVTLKEQCKMVIKDLLASQKQKQIEEIVGIAEKMKLGEFAHYSCGDGEGSCECTEPDYDRALDDLITKIQAKQ